MHRSVPDRITTLRVRFSAQWRSTLTALMAAVLLCTATFTGFCETRCDLSRFGDTSCHGQDVPGNPVAHAGVNGMRGMMMGQSPDSRPDAARNASGHNAVAAADPCIANVVCAHQACPHQFCAAQPALLTQRHAWPGPPLVVEDLGLGHPEAFGLMKHRSVAHSPSLLPHRALATPVSQRTTLRV